MGKNETKRHDGRKGTCRKEGVTDVGGRLERAEDALYTRMTLSMRKLNKSCIKYKALFICY